MHGARKKETIKQGANQPQYRPRKRSREYMKEQSEQIAQLQALESVGFELGLLVGSRTRGPKAAKLNEAIKDVHNAVTK